MGQFVRATWSYGVRVSTLDSESSDRGSNPRRTFFVRPKYRPGMFARHHRRVTVEVVVRRVLQEQCSVVHVWHFRRVGPVESMLQCSYGVRFNDVVTVWFCCVATGSCRLMCVSPFYPLAAIAQLGERQTEDLKVPGSIPGLGICLVVFHCTHAPVETLPASSIEKDKTYEFRIGWV